jgi:uncharacterized protein (TIGR02452 family)
MKKTTRIATAQDTLKVIEKGIYNLPTGEVVSIREAQMTAETNTRFYSSEDLQASYEKFVGKATYTTAYQVTQQTTIEGLLALSQNNAEKIGILNFASAKNAGGGFLGGAHAQEESLARSSGLYGCLLKAPQYYSLHRNTKSCLYTDSMIYAPQVPFFKDDDGEYLPTTYHADVLTSPAVNAGVVRTQEFDNIAEILPVTRLRMQKLLMLLAQNQCVDIILGAWGCGVFQNLPTDIAQLFYECLEGQYKGVFRQVLFAIKSDKPAMLAPFQARFGA